MKRSHQPSNQKIPTIDEDSLPRGHAAIVTRAATYPSRNIIILSIFFAAKIGDIPGVLPAKKVITPPRVRQACLGVARASARTTGEQPSLSRRSPPWHRPPETAASDSCSRPTRHRAPDRRMVADPFARLSHPGHLRHEGGCRQGSEPRAVPQPYVTTIVFTGRLSRRQSPYFGRVDSRIVVRFPVLHLDR